VHLYLFFKTKNTEKNKARVNKHRRKVLLLGLLLLFVFISVASAVIYNSMRVQSEVGVNAAFVFSMSLLVVAYL